MRIAVLVKQVPDSANVKMDPETGTMKREGVEAVVNPDDLSAVETAMLLKDTDSLIHVTAISMGPPAAENAIRETLSMGVDAGMLLSDRKFGGADTWATSYVVSCAIEKFGPFDLIICGERATDGETGQVGPETAAHLDLPLVTFVRKIVELNLDSVKLERSVEDGIETITAPLPIVITVGREIGIPRLGTIRTKMKAKKMEVPIYNAEALGADETKIGLKGSPTKVVKIETPKLTRKGDLIYVANAEEAQVAAERFAVFLTKRDLLDFIPGIDTEGRAK